MQQNITLDTCKLSQAIQLEAHMEANHKLLNREVALDLTGLDLCLIAPSAAWPTDHFPLSSSVSSSRLHLFPAVLESCYPHF